MLEGTAGNMKVKAYGEEKLKLYKVYISHTPARLMTDSPYFYISLVFMILGTQLFLAGFLGELIVRNNREKKLYLVQKEINLN